MTDKQYPPIIEICMENAICNMKCKYCFGGFVDNHNQHTGQIPKFDSSVLDKALRRVASDYRGGIKIWGGEPLANWETFVQIANYVRQKFPLAQLLLVTNGSLLDKEKAKFLANLHFKVNISHDGSGQSLRGSDFLVKDSKQVEAIKYLKLNDAFGTFHMVIHSKSDDLNSQIDYWSNVSENIVEFPFVVTWSIFRITDSWTEEFIPNMSKHNEFIDYTFEQMTQKVKGIYNNRVQFAFSTDQDRALRYLILGEVSEYPCSTFDAITVGLSGSYYRCVQDNERRSNNAADKLLTKDSYKLLDDCKQCLVRPMCAGMCAILTDEQRKKNCSNYKNFLTYMATYLNSNVPRRDIIAKYLGAIPKEDSKCQNQAKSLD